jgi:dTDP-6-deoxy-L-talose 4-dehydrogenase (NAD+)
MKVAVTGARGFLGRHVLTELARSQVEIVATARIDTQNDCSVKSSVQWVTLDIGLPPERCFEVLGEPDVLIHLAWAGLPNYRSLHHFETELPRQYRFLAGLVREGLPSLVTVGTCFEYGLQSGPLAADIETRPDNPYGMAKDTLRKQLQYLKILHPFNLTWARLFYMYGEGQPETSLFPMLEKAVAAGHSVFKMSGGEQLRDYLPVTEVATRLVALALKPRDLGPVNICSGTPISVRSLVEGWVKEYRWKIKLQLGQLPYSDYEPMAFWGDAAGDEMVGPQAAARSAGRISCGVSSQTLGRKKQGSRK